MQKAIRRVVGAEPKASDEVPHAISVGWDRVVEIREENENLGSYGITWFVGYDKDGNPSLKMNALHVAFVEYAS